MESALSLQTEAISRGCHASMKKQPVVTMETEKT